ncbi:amidase [Henriciella aquimarina]|uniref:amidase n=1 Tax=Henriciella aquimarina TaxID=545261 RepID=UPI000A058F08|nr:amidase family protein [Henriciella aquimarina]
MSTTTLTGICDLDAHAQADLVHRGEVTPKELVEAAFQRIEQLNPVLNAVSHVATDHAFAAAEAMDRDAPMAGVPCLLKASMEYPGFPHVSGSRTRKDAIGQTKYPFAEKMEAAGLIPSGITTMPEFGLIGSGEALVYGPTHNPWNTAHGAGGSSSGAGVAVASGMVPFATGSDGGGSIRIPASHTGTVGFKPSRNWNLRSRGPGLMDDLLASDGLLARSMRDAVWAAQTLRTQPPEEVLIQKPLRIALNLTGIDGAPPEAQIADIITRTAQLCEDLGHHVQDVGPLMDMDAIGQAFDVLWSYGAGEAVDLCRAKLGATADTLLEPWSLGLAARRSDHTPDDLARALAMVGRIDQALDLFWNEYDVVLSPVTSNPPPPLRVLAPDRDFDALWRDHFRHVNYTQFQNMAGYPGISLPLFECAEGLPAGSMFWGPHGADDLLLALGCQLEMACPWSGRRPPMLVKPGP